MAAYPLAGPRIAVQSLDGLRGGELLAVPENRYRDLSLGFTTVRLASPMIEEGGSSDWNHETSLPLEGDPGDPPWRWIRHKMAVTDFDGFVRVKPEIGCGTRFETRP